MAKTVPAASVETVFVIGRSAVDSLTPEDEQPANAEAAAEAMVSAPAIVRQVVLMA